MIQITSPSKFIALIIVIVAIVGGIVLKIAWGSAESQKTGEFTIESGQGSNAVWANLIEEGYFTRTAPLRYYGWREDAGSSIQAGRYNIQMGESAADVVHRFVKGDVNLNELTLTFPEGFTLEQIAARSEEAGIGTSEEFIVAAKPELYADEFPFLAEIPAGRSLEGYLFPDTYRVFVDDTPEDLIRRMLANFNAKVTPDLRSEAATGGRTLDQIVNMASIIEREVILDKDMAMVSGVLWKRIADGEGLFVDATTRYILNKWDGALTVQDLAIDSPYNTRKYRGLPPGPISNPGIRAITAAIRPTDSEFYYYLSAPSGETIFSRTNDEHNVNKAQYLQ